MFTFGPFAHPERQLASERQEVREIGVGNTKLPWSLNLSRWNPYFTYLVKFERGEAVAVSNLKERGSSVREAW